MPDKVSFSMNARRALLRAGRLLRRAFGRERTVYVDERVDEYRGYWRQAAALLPAEFRELTDDVWEVRLGDRRTRIANYVTEADDPVTLHLAGNKSYCVRLARQLNIPVATIGEYRLSQWQEAAAAIRSQVGPWVVKPVAGASSGLGVTTQIHTRSELKRACLLASLYSPTFLLERFVPAESCRLLYLNGELIHAVRRRGVRVTGDGKSTITQLLTAEGDSGLNGDPAARLTLERQGLDFASVPVAAAATVVRHIPRDKDRHRELRTVYDQTITEQVGEELREQMAALVRALRCHFAGVDVLTNDPSAALEESGGVFLEINTTPGIHHHYIESDASDGQPVAFKVLEYLLGGSHLCKTDLKSVLPVSRI